MNIINYLFQPVGFIAAVCVLSALAAFIIFSLLRQDKKLSKLGELEKKESAARQELAKSKEESSLKDKMYNGLKGQYDELEKDAEKMSKESYALKSEIENLKKAPIIKEPPKKFNPSFSIPDEDNIKFEIEDKPKAEEKPKIEEKPKFEEKIKFEMEDEPKIEFKTKIEEKPKVEEKPKGPSKLENIPNQSITNLLQQIKSIDSPPKAKPE